MSSEGLYGLRDADYFEIELDPGYANKPTGIINHLFGPIIARYINLHRILND